MQKHIFKRDILQTGNLIYQCNQLMILQRSLDNAISGLFDYRIWIGIHSESEPKVNPIHIRDA